MTKVLITAILLALNMSPVSAAAPAIQVWYNYTRTSPKSPNIAFGLPGRTQRWVNILGNVQSDVGIAALTYSINGGPEHPLGIGPRRRLVDAGDFNVEVDPADPAEPFASGANSIKLKATDNNGAVATQTVTVDYAQGQVWPYPYTVDWQSAKIQDIESVAHVVDGKWQITRKGIRTLQTGYDRTIALGDWSWSTHFKSVTVPFIVHTDFSGITADFSGIGFGIGWQGHRDGIAKPFKGWPGTFAWIRGPLSNPELNIMTYDPTLWEVVHASQPVSIALNTPYLLKSYVQPVDGATSNFCIKLWPQKENEPAGWNLCSHVPYRDGSVLLVAYNADATFGNVSVGGLIAHWPMNTGTGASTPDASGNGHTGTLANGARLTADGSVQLDGVDDYVDVGKPNISGKSMTASAWIWSDDLDNCPKRSCSILSKAAGFSGQTQDLAISTVKKGSKTRLRFRLKINGRTSTLTSTSGTIENNTWIHVAAVYDGKKMRLYQDGVQVGSKVQKGKITFKNQNPIWIGGNSSNATLQPWKGKIDEVRLYSNALPQQEIAELAR